MYDMATNERSRSATNRMVFSPVRIWTGARILSVSAVSDVDYLVANLTSRTVIPTAHVSEALVINRGSLPP